MGGVGTPYTDNLTNVTLMHPTVKGSLLRVRRAKFKAYSPAKISYSVRFKENSKKKKLVEIGEKEMNGMKKCGNVG